MEELSWLGVVRHGESTGNVAREVAEAGGLAMIDILERDADVPLSATGREQAAAVGRWLGGLPAPERPEVLLTSPYLRAVETAEIALAESGVALPLRRDERLRDRELGILDLLTTRGVEQRYPDEALRRARLGKMYYRPPGGESWADVALRLRAVLDEARAGYPGGRVLLVAHEAVILLLRYLVEDLTEAQLMEIARGTVLANTGVTWWRRDPSGLVPGAFNDVAHLQEHGGRPTEEDDVHAEAV